MQFIVRALHTIVNLINRANEIILLNIYQWKNIICEIAQEKGDWTCSDLVCKYVN